MTVINLEPDGRFPRPPEPVAENLGELEALVEKSGADVGLRRRSGRRPAGARRRRGRAIGEDYTLALAARVVLKQRPGTVVTNLSTSRIVDDVAVQAGGRVIRAPVGEVNVAVRMRDEGAVVGGEGNGGVILPELHLGRDAPLAAALVLQLLADEGRHAVRRSSPDYPRYAIVKDKLDRPPVRVWTRCTMRCDAAFPDAAGRHAGWAATVVAGPLGARPAVGNRADRAGDRRSAVARSAAR